MESSFEWKETGKRDIGLIAEEVGQVVPEVVNYKKNGVDVQSVDYSRLVAVLIEAIREQQNKIRQLKGQLDQLKVTLGDLQAQVR